MTKRINISIFLILLSIAGLGQTDSSKIEIYLLKRFVQPHKDSKSFSITENDLQHTPLIADNEIIGYDTITYEITIDTSACYKIIGLKPGLPIGIQFALTVDKSPILTGYLWNPISSFGCNWYAIQASCNNKLKIYKGLPEHLNKEIPELRKNLILIKAFNKTNRLMNLNDPQSISSILTIIENKPTYTVNDVLINDIRFIHIDASTIDSINVIKPENQKNIYGNQNGIIEITINRKIFENLRLKDFFEFMILNSDSIIFIVDNEKVLKEDIIDSMVSEYKKIDFNTIDNQVILLRKNIR